jgi:rhodanese-related sulfurtransferase
MFKNIYFAELTTFLNQADDCTKILLLDVRHPYEYEELSLPKARLIPLPQLAERIDELRDFKEQTIVVYCKAGIRSAIACKILASFGFKNLYNLADGIEGKFC